MYNKAPVTPAFSYGPKIVAMDAKDANMLSQTVYIFFYSFALKYVYRAVRMSKWSNMMLQLTLNQKSTKMHRY